MHLATSNRRRHRHLAQVKVELQRAGDDLAQARVVAIDAQVHRQRLLQARQEALEFVLLQPQAALVELLEGAVLPVELAPHDLLGLLLPVPLLALVHGVLLRFGARALPVGLFWLSISCTKSRTLSPSSSDGSGMAAARFASPSSESESLS